MAGTFFKAISAIGLKTSAFLQSLFLFPFNVVLQLAVGRFPGLRQTTQPTLPCSTSASASASASSSSKETRNNDVSAGSSSSSSSSHNGSDMTTASPASAASESQGQKTHVSKIVPALPRTPPAGKENRAPPTASPSQVDAQLTDKLSRLDLDEAGTAAAATTSARDAGAGTGKQAAQNDGADDVTRALPVPLTPSVSQIGGLKEATTTTTTTIQLDGETVQVQAKVQTPEQAAERAIHSRFMREALDMAKLALKTNETPVGCVLVYKGRVIARGMNATNVTRNGTRHAELMAISALLSYSPSSDLEPAKNSLPERAAATRTPLGDKTNQPQPAEETSTWGDVDPKDGHLYPYGQKLHPSPRVDASVIHECILYVTVEPCVMCASLLRQLGVKKVYFGAVNDKFGGTGGVFRIHKNSPSSMASAPPSPAPQNGKGIVRPVLEPRPASTDIITVEQGPVEEAYDENNVSVSPIEPSNLPGDGGNIERGYEAEGGWGRDEAVTLLRQFYVQENNRAPVPRKKEGRAARLAALMNGPESGSSDMPKSQDDSGTNTPDIQESTIEAGVEAIAA
ncbi:hypothetical protein C8A00DRAFT_45746 [Chaetomidium leptoderma]|uniref:CMP/dCMP-type deaminase domain-containing protein n=1 Tax=Chaetomidium leptoderma TaxID=669021 RepID=A0AAN6ZW18_9PEZI|nr:hypothetical protein C8A00DRAFT_45746 [Chaetomidium leptoderma]